MRDVELDITDDVSLARAAFSEGGRARKYAVRRPRPGSQVGIDYEGQPLVRGTVTENVRGGPPRRSVVVTGEGDDDTYPVNDRLLKDDAGVSYGDPEDYAEGDAAPGHNYRPGDRVRYSTMTQEEGKGDWHGGAFGRRMTVHHDQTQAPAGHVTLTGQGATFHAPLAHVRIDGGAYAERPEKVHRIEDVDPPPVRPRQLRRPQTLEEWGRMIDSAYEPGGMENRRNPLHGQHDDELDMAERPEKVSRIEDVDPPPVRPRQLRRQRTLDDLTGFLRSSVRPGADGPENRERFDLEDFLAHAERRPAPGSRVVHDAGPGRTGTYEGPRGGDPEGAVGLVRYDQGGTRLVRHRDLKDATGRGYGDEEDFDEAQPEKPQTQSPPPESPRPQTTEQPRSRRGQRSDHPVMKGLRFLARWLGPDFHHPVRQAMRAAGVERGDIYPADYAEDEEVDVEDDLSDDLPLRRDPAGKRRPRPLTDAEIRRNRQDHPEVPFGERCRARKHAEPGEAPAARPAVRHGGRGRYGHPLMPDELRQLHYAAQAGDEVAPHAIADWYEDHGVPVEGGEGAWEPGYERAGPAMQQAAGEHAREVSRLERQILGGRGLDHFLDHAATPGGPYEHGFEATLDPEDAEEHVLGQHIERTYRGGRGGVTGRVRWRAGGHPQNWRPAWAAKTPNVLPLRAPAGGPEQHSERPRARRRR